MQFLDTLVDSEKRHVSRLVKRDLCTSKESHYTRKETYETYGKHLQQRRTEVIPEQGPVCAHRVLSALSQTRTRLVLFAFQSRFAPLSVAFPQAPAHTQCCSVLQRVALCCNVLQCPAGSDILCFSIAICAPFRRVSARFGTHTVLHAHCCSVSQCVAVCCSVLHCIAVPCSVF